MTIIKGQIESLKRVKEELQLRGIERFNSIGEINSFLKNYEGEKQEILNKTAKDLEVEMTELQADKDKLQKEFEILKAAESLKLRDKIEKLTTKCKRLATDHRTNNIIKVFNYIERFFLKKWEAYLTKNFDKIIFKKTFVKAQKIHVTNSMIHEYTINKDKVIHQRSVLKINELTYTKKVVDDLNPLIAGAVGENMVVSELKKLSDSNILINDLSIKFDKPIYNRKENDRIFSIQIDHLLVTKAGVFIIETKNWSKESIKKFDLRSPVQQIRRTSFALFVLLNGENGLKLDKHHWGEREIPIRNLIVMINHKPKEKFKYVDVKTLNELNKYLSYFDPVLKELEVIGIAIYLGGLKK